MGIRKQQRGGPRGRLVDAMGRNQTRRLLALWPKSEEPAQRREQATPVRDRVDVAATEALAARVTTLGDTRLAVVTAGRENADVRRMTRRFARAIDRNWTAMQDERSVEPLTGFQRLP